VEVTQTLDAVIEFLCNMAKLEHDEEEVLKKWQGTIVFAIVLVI